MFKDLILEIRNEKVGAKATHIYFADAVNDVYIENDFMDWIDPNLQKGKYGGCTASYVYYTKAELRRHLDSDLEDGYQVVHGSIDEILC